MPSELDRLIAESIVSMMQFITWCGVEDKMKYKEKVKSKLFNWTVTPRHWRRKSSFL